MKKAIVLVLMLGGCMDGASMTPGEQAAVDASARDFGYALGQALAGGGGSVHQPREVNCRTWGQNVRCY